MHDQDTFERTRAPADVGNGGSRVSTAAETAADTAKDEARTVARTAKQDAGAVVGEAKSQARRLASQARDTVADRAREQHGRAVQRLRGLSDEFREMAGDGDTPGRALVADAAERGRRVADYLDARGPEGLLREVQDFARRRPMAFLAGAIAAGFVVGRLGKNIWKAESGSSQAPLAGSPTAVAVVAEPVVAPVETPSPYASETYEERR